MDNQQAENPSHPKALFDLSGKVALVTGGTRGLGLVMAYGFAQAGAEVIVASRKADACEQVAADIHEQTGRRTLGIGCHVGQWDTLDGVVHECYSNFSGIDILVNNAGMSPVYDSEVDVTEALFDKVIDVNLKGPFRLAALIGTRMAQGSGGSIINISSAGAVHPRPGILPYSAAKAGLNAITVGLAHAYGPSVRVNAIMAGTFLTDVSAAWDKQAFAARSAKFALQRGGQPGEILGTALYLASDASTYTTGSIITVDGGQP